jgi:hypothetical protein
VEFEVRLLDFYTIGLTNCNACHPPDALMLTNIIRFISLIQAGFLCITISCAFPQSQARHFRCYAIENLHSARLDGGCVRTKKSQMTVTVVPLTPICTSTSPEYAIFTSVFTGASKSLPGPKNEAIIVPASMNMYPYGLTIRRKILLVKKNPSRNGINS